MNLKNTIVTDSALVLVMGMVAFSARKHSHSSLFGRSARPQSSLPRSLDPETAADIEREVRALLAQGRKVMAVKYVRETTNWGLKASKDFVDALEADPYASPYEGFAATRTSQSVSLPADALVEVRAFVRQGRIIEAIKRVRAATNCGLKEAKDYVDSLR